MLIIESDSPPIVWFSVILSWMCYIFHLRLSHLRRIFFLRHKVKKLDFVAGLAGIRNWVTQNLKKTSPFFSPHQNLIESKLIYERSKILILYNNVRSYGNFHFWGSPKSSKVSLLETSCSNQFGRKALPDMFLSQEESFTDRVSNKLKKVKIFLGGGFFPQNGDF